MFAATVFPVIFYDRRVTIYALGLSVSIMAVFGWAFSTGRIVIPIELFATSLETISWVIGTIVFVMMVSLLVISQSYLVPTLTRTIETSQEAELAMLQSEQRFRTVVESSRNGIFIIGDQFKLTYVNERCSQILGYTEAELVGLDFREVLDEDSKQMVADRYVRRQQGERLPPRYEIGIVRKDGSLRKLELSVVVVKDADGRPETIGQVMDITDRKQTEKIIEEERAFLQRVIDVDPNFLFVKDRDSRFVMANKALADAYGSTPEGLIGKSDADFNPNQEEVDHFHREDLKVIDDQVESVVEEPITTASGEVRWLHTIKRPLVDEDGVARQLFGVCMDITDRKRAEEAVEEERAFLQRVIDVDPSFLFVKDRDSRFVMANKALADAYGSTPQGLIGKSDADFNPNQEEVDHFHREDLKVIDDQVESVVEEPITTASGEVRWLHTIKRPLVDEDGVARQLFGVCMDITDRKILENQVKDAFERRGYQVQVSTEIAQEITQATELGEIFDRVVTLVKDHLGYYHTQLLQYDPVQDEVVLISGYGEAGAAMLDEGHSMPMGVGLIGTAAQTENTVMRLDLAEDPDWQPNPLLPDTRSEIAVPIKLGDQILGVLDVQSDQAGGFSDDDRLLLEGLCGQIAIAMEQTRLRLEMDERLEEINALYRTMSREGWQRYHDSADLPGGFVFDQSDVQPVDASALADELFSQIPLTLPGGEIVGSLGIDEHSENPLSKEDRQFLEQASEQIALALESARLTEQTQAALTQTEDLYQIGSELNAAENEEQILSAVSRPAIQAGCKEATLMFIDYVAGNPEKMTLVANWKREGDPVFPVGFEFDLTSFPATQFFMAHPDQVQMIPDIPNAEHIDDMLKEIWAQSGSQAIVIVPLVHAGTWLGIITFSWSEVHRYSDHERAIYNSLLSLVTPVVHSRRLYLDTQRQAENEALINIMGQRIQSTTSIEDALQVAIKELGQALDVKKTSVQLGLPEK